MVVKPNTQYFFDCMLNFHVKGVFNYAMLICIHTTSLLLYVVNVLMKSLKHFKCDSECIYEICCL